MQNEGVCPTIYQGSGGGGNCNYLFVFPRMELRFLEPFGIPFPRTLNSAHFPCPYFPPRLVFSKLEHLKHYTRHLTHVGSSVQAHETVQEYDMVPKNYPSRLGPFSHLTLGPDTLECRKCVQLCVPAEL
jgi:hypothetical protein